MRLLLSLLLAAAAVTNVGALKEPTTVPAHASEGSSQPPRPGDIRTLHLGAGVRMELVYVAGGSFSMGSPESERDPICRRLASDRDNPFTRDVLDTMRLEGPVHVVELDGFWMGKCEVTVEQFRRFAEQASYRTEAEREGESQGVGPSGGWSRVPRLSWRAPGFSQGNNHPVVHVSWNDAKAFCDWLSRKEAVLVRLPTEAEWEYACRAGTRTAYHWGDDPNGGKGMLNGADLTAKRKYPTWPSFDFEDGYVCTAPVGSFSANGFGLHDMHGNVWEWCEDHFGETYYASSPRRNPRGPSSGTYRMSRGGSWDYYDNLYRSAVRVRLSPSSTYCGQGFRVVCVPTVPTPTGEGGIAPPPK